MAAANSKQTGKNNQKDEDEKGHPIGCRCEKCNYFQVSPRADLVSDDKVQTKPGDGVTLGADANRLPMLIASGRVHKLNKKGQRVGVQPLRLRIPFSFAVAATAATGIVSNVTTLLPDSNGVEWNALNTLYNEYRLMGIHVDFTPVYQSPPGSAIVDALMYVLAYDPLNSAALTSVRAGSELTYHKVVYGHPMTQQTNSSALVNSFANVTGKPHQLKAKVDNLMALQGSGTALTGAPGQWLVMNAAGSNTNQGYLKSYGVSDWTTAGTAVGGIVYMDIEFRSRV